MSSQSQISGTAEGIDILFSRDNLALAIHNQATRGEVALDEHLATVCTLTGTKISRIDTYLSDVSGMDAFFAELP